jgi:hypothetical protein
MLSINGRTMIQTASRDLPGRDAIRLALTLTDDNAA